MIMISEESCDTEDWSYDASASITEIITFTIYSHRNKLLEIVIIFHNIHISAVFLTK